MKIKKNLSSRFSYDVPQPFYPEVVNMKYQEIRHILKLSTGSNFQVDCGVGVIYGNKL